MGTCYAFFMYSVFKHPWQEYDINQQFWSQVQVSPGGPSARWGASGGIDIRTPANQDPIVPGPNNTFYLAGGFDGTTTSPLSDVWRLNVSGILSSNLPTDVRGSWEHLGIPDLPGRVDQAGTVVGQQVIAVGGCDSSSSPTTSNTSCARQDAFVINTVSLSELSPGPCAAPRIGSVLVPNMNGISKSFASQLFLLLGAFNSSLWQDSNGLAEGEVVSTLSPWARLLLHLFLNRLYWISTPILGPESYLLGIPTLQGKFISLLLA